VTSISFVSEPRVIVSLTLSPACLPASAAWYSARSLTAVPSTFVITSSTLSPAFSAGPSPVTAVTVSLSAAKVTPV
jgi:hypothetical protein